MSKAKLNTSRLHQEEPAFRYVADCSKEEIDDAPDFFVCGRRFNVFDRIKIFCPYPNGFWVRTYWVVTENPLKVAPEGNWKRVAKADEAPPEPVGRTAREVFVPFGCAPEDLDSDGYLFKDGVKEEGVPPWVTWKVVGRGTGRIYALGLPDKETADEVRVGAKPYSIEAMERTA